MLRQLARQLHRGGGRPLALRVQGGQLDRLLHGALRVVFQEQIEREAGVGEPSGGVQARPEDIAYGIGVQAGVLQPGGLH